MPIRTEMAARGRVRVEKLDRAAIEDVLRRNRVGRLAFRSGDAVDLEPIHYVFSGGSIVGRTSPGTKLSALALDHRIAFEVDEWDSLFSWRSVVVKAPLLRVPSHRSAEWNAARAALRELVPGAFGPDDPTPERTVVFRIPTEGATGRAAREE